MRYFYSLGFRHVRGSFDEDIEVEMVMHSKKYTKEQLEFYLRESLEKIDKNKKDRKLPFKERCQKAFNYLVKHYGFQYFHFEPRASHAEYSIERR